MMTIRKTAPGDLAEVMEIYAGAQRFMLESGNLHQWGVGYPPTSLVKQDIEMGHSFVLADSEGLAGVFYFRVGSDPTYHYIEGGWPSDAPYGVVHRIASAGRTRGVARACFDWCLTQCDNLRIDTHEDNMVMRGLLEAYGFTYCGRIFLENGAPRLAYHSPTA